MALGFAKYSKGSSETQVSYTLKKHHRVLISRSIQNGWAFKMVVVSTCCAIAADHAFNLGSIKEVFREPRDQDLKEVAGIQALPPTPACRGSNEVELG